MVFRSLLGVTTIVWISGCIGHGSIRFTNNTEWNCVEHSIERIRADGALGTSAATTTGGHEPLERRQFALTDFIDIQSEESNQALEPTPTSLRVDLDRTRPLPDFWRTVKRDLKRFPRQIWEDTKAVYGDGTNLLILGGTYAASLAMQETGPDHTVEHRFENHRFFKEDWSDAFATAGNPVVHFGLAGTWYLVGQLSDDEETFKVGQELFRALTVTGLSTTVGKLATWDRGPNGEWGAFPSGHASSTFAFASVLHEHYGPWVGFPLYGVGVLVGVERLDSGEHYLSDVVMGSVMGLVIGHTIASGNDVEMAGGRIVPYADPYAGASGLAWVVPIGKSRIHRATMSDANRLR